MTHSPYVPPQAGPIEVTRSPRPRARVVVTVALVALGVGGSLVGCKTDESSTASATNDPSLAPTVTVAAPSSPVAVAPPAATTPVSSAPAPAAVDFVMPSLVGIDLQTAQNQVQQHGVFFSVSHDLRGSRHQVLDSNWMVCTQNFAPGQRMTGHLEGKIDFGVVKRGESCP